ncbi:MAG: flagellar assembly protein FliW [Armatimonadota bacterium]
MQITTTRFGNINVKEDSIIYMDDVMLGFEHCTSYVLLQDSPDTVFKWMQAIDDPTVAFLVINPNDFFPDYEVELTDEQAKSLELSNPHDSVMFTTVTLDRESTKATTNLVGPIVLNVQTMHASQIVLQDDRYTTKQTIWERSQSSTDRELVKAA